METSRNERVMAFLEGSGKFFKFFFSVSLFTPAICFGLLMLNLASQPSSKKGNDL